MIVQSDINKFLAVITVSLFMSCIVYPADVNQQPDQVDEQAALQIYLPREVAIDGDILKLGQIGIAQGQLDLVASANKVGLGRFSVPGQEIVLDKQVIISRLAANGISAEQIVMTGAEQVTVRQKAYIISADEFVKQAQTFLENNNSDSTIAGWENIRKPDEMILSEGVKDIKYNFRIIDNGVKNQRYIEVVVFSGDQKLDVRNVTFAAQYSCKTIVSLVDIPAGQLISEENVKVETKISNQPQVWQQPYGLMAKRSISAGAEIRSNMLGSVEPAAVIKRNQNVVIRIEQPGFTISTLGKALQDGKTDELIKVRNVDSQRIIIAKVRQDMSVEPVY